MKESSMLFWGGSVLSLDKHRASYIETSQVYIQGKTQKNYLDSSQTYSLCHLWACQSQHLLTAHYISGAIPHIACYPSNPIILLSESSLSCLHVRKSRHSEAKQCSQQVMEGSLSQAISSNIDAPYWSAVLIVTSTPQQIF